MVVLDLNLPKVSGAEVLRRLRAHPKTALVPVIVMTSSREERDLVETYRSGANSYIRKPLESERLGEAVRQIGAYWLSLNEPPPPTVVGR